MLLPKSFRSKIQPALWGDDMADDQKIWISLHIAPFNPSWSAIYRNRSTEKMLNSFRVLVH